MRWPILFALVVAASPARAAPCHQGDVVAERDADLAPLDGVTCLEGSLTLTRDVAKLAPLKSLALITGNLTVVHAERLASLRGLDGVTEIRGSVRIGGPKQGTPKLRDVDGLRSLREIGGDLSIAGGYIFEPGKSRMSPIHAVSGLTSLTRVRGDIHLFDLHGFRGLRALVEIGGDLELRLTKLATLRGFDKLETIGGTLRFDGNGKLRRIATFGALKSIGGDFDVGCRNRNDSLAESAVRDRLANVTIKGRFWYVAPGTPHHPDRQACQP